MADTDAIEVRFKTLRFFCRVCDCYVDDPENHQWHASVVVDTDEPKEDES